MSGTLFVEASVSIRPEHRKLIKTHNYLIAQEYAIPADMISDLAKIGIETDKHTPITGEPVMKAEIDYSGDIFDGDGVTIEISDLPKGAEVIHFWMEA